VVAAPLRLAAVERGATSDRDEDVLERGPARVVRVDVPRRDRGDAQRLGKVPQGSEPPRVAALVRPLELDEEALGPERPRQRRRSVRAPRAEPVPRAAREAEEPFVQLREQRSVERGR
jgi:hypothetical protein